MGRKKIVNNVKNIQVGWQDYLLLSDFEVLGKGQSSSKPKAPATNAHQLKMLAGQADTDEAGTSNSHMTPMRMLRGWRGRRLVRLPSW